MAMVTLSAVIHREDDLYIAECPELGTVSQGRRKRSPISRTRQGSTMRNRLSR
jgi:hypothetical protein